MLFLLVACGSGDGGTINSGLDTKQKEAIQTIATYAQGSPERPTVQDYLDAGVSGVTNTNLTNINNEIRRYNYEDVDETVEIQEVVDTVVTRTVNVNEALHVYGKGGSHPTAHHDEVDANMTTVYYPTDIPEGTKVPVVFFASGYNSTNSKDYESLLTFIASQGYYVIYSKQNKDHWNDVFTNLDKMLDDANGIHPKLDTTRIGVIGHSLGGGYAFNILKHFSDLGYGENGRFIMALEAWYAFNLTEEELKHLPSNTNVVMQQYGAGGNNAINDTDPRIPLTEFYLLDSIAKTQKDWQIVENADHHYPYGSGAYSAMQGILNPLDALMEWTFKGTPSAHDLALEQGSDDPYGHGKGIQVLKPIADYKYKCDGNHDVTIDYCDMVQWYANKQLILSQKGNWLPSMAGNFETRAAYINTLPFSGFTMVGNSFTDRVMESNTSLLSYSYIWDEVKGVKGLYPTKSNFLMVDMHFPGDFWDDTVWNNVIVNFKTLAKVAKNLGFRGIVYDDEPYDAESHKMNNYKHGNAWYDENAYKNPNHTFQEHVAKITARHQQIMEAMISEYNAIDVLYYHSPVEGHIEANDGINGHPVVVNAGLERQHEMTGAIFVGLKKGLSPQATLHDMGEDYRLRTQAHFDDAYAWRKHTIASNVTNDAVDATQHWVVPLEERATWAEDVDVDFMVSNEPLVSAAYPEFDTTDKVSLNDMKTTLERALAKSDKYVTFYSASSSDNKGGLIQLDWLNDPATHADDGSSYGLDPAWKSMVQDVYTNKVLK
jgi:pimeloyl-ACP methyl ester carboxylesterase